MSAKAQLETTTEEIRQLQACINNLVSIMALLALWDGQDPGQLVATLLEGLIRMLRLDFARAQLINPETGPPSVVIRIAQQHSETTHPEEEKGTFDRTAADDTLVGLINVIDPAGNGEMSTASLKLGLQDEFGVLTAGCRRPDFPTKLEMLLLGVAANQAAIGLQKHRLLGEQRRASEELELRVLERTGQLTALNESLRKEIVDRKRAEVEQRKLASLVENSTDFIAIASPDGQTLFINPAGQRMIGLNGDEQVQATCMLGFCTEEERERFQNEVQPAIIQEGRWEGELNFRHFENGTSIPMLHHIFFIKEQGSDRRLALATISRDMTERKRVEMSLQTAQAELAHATRMATLGELTATIAHEINQPLGAIVTHGQACLRLLSQPAPNLERVRESLVHTVADTLRASEVIKGIRTLLNRADPGKEPLNINETIRDVVALALNELKTNRVSIRTELETDLQSVLGNRVQLQQVVLNLILNGSEAMSGEGSSSPRELQIKSEKSISDEIVVAVSDSGGGLGPIDAQHIFEPFFTTKEKGLGLGLSISQKIIDAHGGRLWATANADRGLTFRFSLPTHNRSLN
jgi:PAS domain S-box-containing protein